MTDDDKLEREYCPNCGFEGIAWRKFNPELWGRLEKENEVDCPRCGCPLYLRIKTLAEVAEEE